MSELEKIAQILTLNKNFVIRGKICMHFIAFESISSWLGWRILEPISDLYGLKKGKRMVWMIGICALMVFSFRVQRNTTAAYIFQCDSQSRFPFILYSTPIKPCFIWALQNSNLFPTFKISLGRMRCYCFEPKTSKFIKSYCGGGRFEVANEKNFSALWEGIKCLNLRHGKEDALIVVKIYSLPILSNGQRTETSYPDFIIIFRDMFIQIANNVVYN